MILHFSHQIEDEKEPLQVRLLLKEIPTASNTLNLNTLYVFNTIVKETSMKIGFRVIVKSGVVSP